MLKLVIAKVGSEEQLEKEAFRMAAGGEQVAPSLVTRSCSLSSGSYGRSGWRPRICRSRDC